MSVVIVFPRPLAPAWLQGPFCIDRCQQALTGASETCKASVNFWALDLMRVPNIPLLKNSITKFREHYSGAPAVLPSDVAVAVACPRSAEGDIITPALRQVSAPEMAWPYLEAINLDLAKGDDELNAKWRATMLACRFRSGWWRRRTCTISSHCSTTRIWPRPSPRSGFLPSKSSSA